MGWSDIEAGRALEAGNDVAHGVVAHVPHMDAPGRIREHLQDVVFFARIVVTGGEDAPLLPRDLPAGLGLAGVVTLNRHDLVPDEFLCLTNI